MTFIHQPAFLARMLERLKTYTLKDQELVARVQRIIYVFYSALVILQLLANFIGIYGPDNPRITLLEAVCLAGVLITIYLQKTDKLSVGTALSSVLLHGHVLDIVVMFLCAYGYTTQDRVLCMGIMLLIGISIVTSILAFLKVCTIILCTTGVAAIITCMALVGDKDLTSFGIYVLLTDVALMPMLVMVTQGTLSLYHDNKTFTAEEQELFNVLKLEKSQVKAFVKLAKQQTDVNGAVNLMNILGDKAQQNVINNVKAIMTANATERQKMEVLFPELTPTQISISRYILSDKSVSKICLLMNKTESNITTQRSSIRKKLGLAATDDLKAELMKRINSREDHA